LPDQIAIPIQYQSSFNYERATKGMSISLALAKKMVVMALFPELSRVIQVKAILGIIRKR